jgi:hypothetical protein
MVRHILSRSRMKTVASNAICAITAATHELHCRMLYDGYIKEWMNMMLRHMHGEQSD